MNARKFLLGLLDMAVKVFFVIVVIMLISKYSKIAYNYGYQIFSQQAVSSGTGRTVSFTVKNSDNVDDIAENLAGLGLITDKRLFKLQERFSEYHEKEKPGTYELSTAMKPEEMLMVMSGGQEASDEDSAIEEIMQEDKESDEENAQEGVGTESESGDESNGG